MARATSPAGATRLDGRFSERDRARAGVVDVLGAAPGHPTVSASLIGRGKVLDRGRERIETGPKPAPISPDTVIWERSGKGSGVDARRRSRACAQTCAPSTRDGPPASIPLRAQIAGVPRTGGRTVEYPRDLPHESSIIFGRDRQQDAAEPQLGEAKRVVKPTYRATHSHVIHNPKLPEGLCQCRPHRPGRVRNGLLRWGVDGTTFSGGGMQSPGS